ncbi:MAG: cysteine--tRNA ligase [Sphingobacteriales bacterium BACL12 MAG-120813-bin55]|jgi:cysteinyl-tRNA synthetase|nr:MAG: cysteine--tRNA ligase [Sphingobacteriales bacterium BACL12 MAG-120813-bin55]
MPNELFHQNELQVYNTLTRSKEVFRPLHPPFVGLYVCGPTVYSEPHLGNCRTFVSFDVINRYLRHLGYKVRYVRNITDAGHIESTAGDAGDRISEQAKIESVEPMEIVQKYSNAFRQIMARFNTLPPDIEPTATGHIIEQIEMTKAIIESGYGYEVDGNVFFDVERFSKDHPYTQLSGRNLDEMLNNTRDLGGQQLKRGRLDFALWIKAKPEHLQHWPSPWGEGYPGWHIECSAMSTKYLGKEFDIHGGGLDLIPTHHTNEVAQSIACNHTQPVKYWLHTNMLTVNGQKMSKSLGNSFLPEELFSGTHPLLDRGYSPMTVRYFMLQAHYSSTLDFTNEALQAAEKGYKKMMSVVRHLQSVVPSGTVDAEQVRAVNACMVGMYNGMNNDFNTAMAFAAINEVAGLINTWANAGKGKADIDADTLMRLQETITVFVYDIFGLKEETAAGGEVLGGVMNLVIDIRKEAREKRDFAISDKIRDTLQTVGITLKDSKDGTTWEQS